MSLVLLLTVDRIIVQHECGTLESLLSALNRPNFTSVGGCTFSGQMNNSSNDPGAPGSFMPIVHQPVSASFSVGQ